MNTSTYSLPPYGPELRQRVLSAFWKERIEEVPAPAHYWLGLLASTLTMLLLPLLYGGMVLGILVATVLFFLNVSMDSFWLWLSVGLVAPVVLLFLVKPLFAERYQAFRPRPVRRDQEPLLFAFLERLCAAIGAPFPKRVYIDWEVNASASFRRGALSLFDSDLALTIGLPLVSGLNLAQFAGVLAHEFGHFTQGAGMRLTYVVRSINAWFARAVYERDAWDAWLEEHAEDSDTPLPLLLLLNLSRLLIFLTRRVLWLFMICGHGISCFLLRQMEFDADRHEARLVGSEVFESTCWELIVLNVAHDKSIGDLDESLREGRLADNLGGLIVDNRRQMPVRVQDQIRAHRASEKTHIFSSHPADRDRVQNARAETTRPIFRSDLRASVLFRDFAALAKKISLDYYRAVLGPEVGPKDLYPLGEIVERRDRSANDREALDRFFRGVVSPLRPLRLKVGPAAGSGTEELLAAVGELRGKAADALPTLLRDAARYEEAFSRSMEIHGAQALVSAGFSVSADPASAGNLEDQIQGELMELDEKLEEGELNFGRRLLASLFLMKSAELSFRVDGVAEMRRETQPLLQAVQLMDQVHPLVNELHGLRAEVGALAAQLEEYGQVERLHQCLRNTLERLLSQLEEIRNTLGNVPYPLDHADEEKTLKDHVVPTLPDDITLDLHPLSEEVFDRAYDLYFRLVGRLAFIAEQMERAAGLDPLPPQRPAP